MKFALPAIAVMISGLSACQTRPLQAVFENCFALHPVPQTGSLHIESCNTADGIYRYRLKEDGKTITEVFNRDYRHQPLHARTSVHICHSTFIISHGFVEPDADGNFYDTIVYSIENGAQQETASSVTLPDNDCAYDPETSDSDQIRFNGMVRK